MLLSKKPLADQQNGTSCGESCSWLVFVLVKTVATVPYRVKSSFKFPRIGIKKMGGVFKEKEVR